MTQDAVPCLFGEGDLGNEIGLDPMSPAADSARHCREGRFAGLAGFELGAERAQDRLVIARADASLIDEAVLAEFANEEGSEAASLLVGGPIAANDEFGAAETFALDPGRRPARHIGAVARLRNQ